MKLERGTYRTDRGTTWHTPKELWGFRKRVPKGEPLDIANAFLRENADLLGIDGILNRLEERAEEQDSAGSNNLLVHKASSVGGGVEGPGLQGDPRA